MQVGGVLANSFAAVAVEMTGTWRAAFAYPSAALGVAGILLFLLMPSPKSKPKPKPKPTPNADANAKEEVKAGPTPSYMDAVMAPGVLNLAFSYLCVK